MIDAFRQPRRPARGADKWITNMNTRRLIPTLALAGVVSCVASSAAAADSPVAVSGNWSGYEVGAGANKQFSSVSGSWTEPSANCATGQGYSAFWVGLGGAGQQSQGLEQIGTEADCDATGTASHFAWYELVPAAPVRLELPISSGDRVSGRVTVAGTRVTVSLSDQTTGASATKALQMTAPDTSSAEWIAEAPSSCDGSGGCQPLPLTDFGTVDFSNASATADGHTGTLSDPSWTTQPVELSAGAAGYGTGALVSNQPVAGAAPSSLSADGSSFSVTASSGDQSAGSGAAVGGGYPSGGSGYGSVSGDGDSYGGSAFGDSYGYGSGGVTG